MNFLEPLRGDKIVSADGVTYEVGYYQAPSFSTGIVDEGYAEYSASTSFDLNAYCKVSELNAIYRSSTAGNVGNFPPANPYVWTFWGPVNSYKMLAVDEFIGSQTYGYNAVLEFDFSESTAFSLLDMEFYFLKIEQIDDSTGDIVYTEEFHGRDVGCLSYYDYFYAEAKDLNTIYRGELEWLPQSTLRFTFTQGVQIGVVVMGRLEPLGCTLMGTSLKYEDTSTIQKSEVTGFRTITRYGHIKILSASVMIELDIFDIVAQKISRIIGTNILFVPTDSDKFSETITLGYFEEFEIPLENTQSTKTQSTIIGVI